MEESGLRDLRVLIVEDESLIAMLIEDALADLDFTVAGVASSVADALDKASSMEFDVAILDVNLNGAPVFPVAELLLRRNIPFLFSTGYGSSGIPDSYGTVPVLAKPFNEGAVGRAIEAAMKTHAAAKGPEIKG